ncbi:nose resistant to fluoxetine protein 6-like isoform X2 [Ornithodoros turicata]|uniref:nose resistant to fluoxetine protein 6-like isoform X2 n=1 Tax=Ornithodoros turicata TaxID=34597 RepID=UPI003138A14F
MSDICRHSSLKSPPLRTFLQSVSRDDAHLCEPDNCSAATTIPTSKLLDAMSKPEAGILQGGFSSIGSQSECYKVHANLNMSGRDMDGVQYNVNKITGRYCAVRYKIDLAGLLDLVYSEDASSATYRNIINDLLGKDKYLLREVDNVVEEFPGFFGLCIPSTCSKSDMQALFTFVQPLVKSFLNINVSSQVVSCKTQMEADDMQMTPVILAALSALGILLVLMCIGTLLTFLDARNSQCPHKNPNARKSLMGELLRSFSATKNIGLLFAMEDNPSKLQCVHGLRALSIIWVVLGYVLVLHSMMLTQNLILLKDKMKDITIQFLVNFTPGADTLLCVLGMMMVYDTLTKLREENHRRTRGFLFRYLLHRVIRVLPLLLLTTLLIVPLFPYLGEGPTWDIESNRLVSRCSDTWWWNIFLVNNYLSRCQQCMEHTWFFALLMQCTLVGLFIIPVWYHRAAAGHVLSGALVSATVVLTSVVTYMFDLGPTWLLREYRPGSRSEYIEKIYTPMYTRGGVFFVGMIAGYILVHKKKFVMNKLCVLLGWLCSLSVILAIIHIPFKWNRGEDLPDAKVSAAYGGFSRVLWSIAVSWIVIACASGNGGPMNTMLSFKIWLPLSRLMYSWYIVSPLVIIYANGVREHMFFLSYDAMSYVLIHHLVISTAVAIAAAICFELPFLNLEEIIAKRRKPQVDIQETALQVPRVKPFWLEQSGVNPGYVHDRA